MNEKYNRYKNSGEFWIGDIPEHWSIKKFKHIFKEKKKVSNPTLNSGAISFGKVVFKDDDKIPEATKASYQEVLSGEFLINPLNLNYDLISLRIALSNINVVVSSGYIVIKDIIDLDKRFFNYLLHRYDVAYMKLLGSGVRQTINFNHLSNSLLVFPPLHEQTSIASFLDKKTSQIDHAIELKEKTITLLKEHKQIMIQELVTGKVVIDNGEKVIDNGELKIDNARLIKRDEAEMKDSGVEWIGMVPKSWEVKRLKYIFNIKNGQDYKHVLADNGYPVIGSGGQFAYASEYLYDGEAVLLGRKGTIDKPMYVSEKFWTVDTMFYAVVNKNHNTKYIYYVATTIPFQLYSTSTALPSMTQSDLNDHCIAAPPLHEQQTIVNYIEQESFKIDNAISMQEQEIEKLKELKATLIDSAVTGKIKVIEN